MGWFSFCIVFSNANGALILFCWFRGRFGSLFVVALSMHKVFQMKMSEHTDSLRPHSEREEGKVRCRNGHCECRYIHFNEFYKLHLRILSVPNQVLALLFFVFARKSGGRCVRCELTVMSDASTNINLPIGFIHTRFVFEKGQLTHTTDKYLPNE